MLAASPMRHNPAAQDVAAAEALAACLAACEAHAWLPCAGIGQPAQTGHERVATLLRRAGQDRMRALPHALPEGTGTATDPMALVFAQFEADPALTAVLLHATRMVQAGFDSEVPVEAFLLVGSTARLQTHQARLAADADADPASDWRMLIAAGLERAAPGLRMHRPVSVSLQCDAEGRPIVGTGQPAQRLDSTQAAAAFLQGWAHLTQPSGDTAPAQVRQPLWVVDRVVSEDSRALQGVSLALAHPRARDVQLPATDLMQGREALHVADAAPDPAGASSVLAWALAGMRLRQQQTQDAAVVLGLRDAERLSLGLLSRSAG